MKYVKYNRQTALNEVPVRVRPVEFYGNEVGFYILRDKTSDRSVVMTVSEAKRFIKAMQKVIDKKIKEEIDE